MNEPLYIDDELGDDEAPTTKPEAEDDDDPVVFDDWGDVVLESKYKERDALAAQVAAFLANGGQIEVIPTGLSRYSPGEHYEFSSHSELPAIGPAAARILRVAVHELNKPGCVTLSRIAKAADTSVDRVLCVLRERMLFHPKAQHLVDLELARRKQT